MKIFVAIIAVGDRAGIAGSHIKTARVFSTLADAEARLPEMRNVCILHGHLNEFGEYYPPASFEGFIFEATSALPHVSDEEAV